MNQEQSPRQDARLTVGMVWMMVIVWSGITVCFYTVNGPWLPFAVLAGVFSWFATQIPSTVAANAIDDQNHAS